MVQYFVKEKDFVGIQNKFDSRYTFSITCYHFNFLNFYHLSKLSKCHIFQHKCPYIVTKSIGVQMSLQHKESAVLNMHSQDFIRQMQRQYLSIYSSHHPFIHILFTNSPIHSLITYFNHFTR